MSAQSEKVCACTYVILGDAKMARTMFTGGWYARSDAVARSCRRQWRNWESLTPKGEHELRRWRKVSVAWV